MKSDVKNFVANDEKYHETLLARDYCGRLKMFSKMFKTRQHFGGDFT